MRSPKQNRHGVVVGVNKNKKGYNKQILSTLNNGVFFYFHINKYFAMSKQQRISQAIKNVVSEMMERVLITDPFIKENHRSNKPNNLFTNTERID